MDYVKGIIKIPFSLQLWPEEFRFIVYCSVLFYEL